MSIIDKNFLSKLLEGEDLSEAYKFQLASAYFDSSERPIWDFVEDFYRRYQSLPSKIVVKEQFDLELPEVKEPLEYWATEILNREVQEKLRELVVSVDQKITIAKPIEAVELIKQFMLDQQKLAVANIEAGPIGDWADSVEKRYEQSKLGLIGLPTPWHKMDLMTGGWSAGDINVLAARSGQGKSWLTILIALKCMQAKKKILYFSGEMTEEDIAGRAFSIQYRIPYSKMRSGRLLPGDEERMKRSLEDFKRATEIIVVKAYAGFTTNDVDMAVQMHKPDVAIIDAAYRLKAVNKVKDRFENMAYVTTELKSVAGKYKIPINFSVQLNRAATSKKGGSFGTEDVAMADAIGWEASNLFFLHSNDELKENKQMEIVPVKVRENANFGKPLLVNWDFEIMNFDEISDFHIQTPKGPSATREDDGF